MIFLLPLVLLCNFCVAFLCFAHSPLFVKLIAVCVDVHYVFCSVCTVWCFALQCGHFRNFHYHSSLLLLSETPQSSATDSALERSAGQRQNNSQKASCLIHRRAVLLSLLSNAVQDNVKTIHRKLS